MPTVGATYGQLNELTHLRYEQHQLVKNDSTVLVRCVTRRLVQPAVRCNSVFCAGLRNYNPDMDLISLIDARPEVRGGKPCFVGTRIAVYDVLEYLASGMSSDQIVADFPELTADHVRAALEFAAVREHRLAAPA